MLLALDLAKVTGWALGSLDERPRYGLLEMSGGEGQRSNKLFVFLERGIAAGVKHIAVESAPDFAWSKGRQTTSETLAALNAYHVVLRLVLARHQLLVSYCPISTLKKTWTGIAKYPDRDAGKAAMVRSAQLRGFADVTDHNIADALGVWHWAQGILKRPIARQSETLFDATARQKQRPYLDRNQRVSVDEARLLMRSK